MYMVGMGGGVSMFLLVVFEALQACNKICTKSVESRDVTKVCSDIYGREGRTDIQEGSKEVEQGTKARLHKYGRGEKFGALILSSKRGIYTYGI